MAPLDIPKEAVNQILVSVSGTPTDPQFMEDLHIPQVIQDHLWTWFDKCSKNENVQAVLWSEPK